MRSVTTSTSSNHLVHEIDSGVVEPWQRDANRLSILIKRLDLAPSIGSDCDPINVSHPLPTRGRIGDPDGCSLGPSIHKPSTANRDPVAGDNQKSGLFKFPVGPLALPSGKGRR